MYTLFMLLEALQHGWDVDGQHAYIAGKWRHTATVSLCSGTRTDKVLLPGKVQTVSKYSAAWESSLRNGLTYSESV